MKHINKHVTLLRHIEFGFSTSGDWLEMDIGAGIRSNWRRNTVLDSDFGKEASVPEKWKSYTFHMAVISLIWIRFWITVTTGPAKNNQ